MSTEELTRYEYCKVYLKYYYNVDISDCYVSLQNELTFETKYFEEYYTHKYSKIVYIID